MNGWTIEALEDSGIKDALSLIDPKLCAEAKHDLDAIAHQVIEGPKSALTERGMPFVSVVGSSVKAEGAVIVGKQLVASGNPLIVTQEAINAAALRARDAWSRGAKDYRKSVCERAGTGAHIVLVWRKHPEFFLWSDWNQCVCLAMRGRLAFETIEDGEQHPSCASSEHNALAASPPPSHAKAVDFFAINRAFSE